jgi:membrane protein implicated in regulation of membrane protease activity
MHRRGPRFGIALALVQTQGIVGVVCAVLAAAIAGLASRGADPVAMWSVAGATFAVTLVALVVYWRRSFDELRKSIRPINPTQPDEIEAPF